ncbi:MAG: flagellar hook-length control protein FliK [Burkholderiales bacterium]|nr:flagellar hook-length control protein FliK [Burkholderiales bacterium]
MMGIENLANSATAALLRPGLAKAVTPASGAAGAAGAFADRLSASLDESPNTGIDTDSETETESDTDPRTGTVQAMGELAQGADWLLQTLAGNQLPPTGPVPRATLELGLVKPAPPAATALAGQVLAKAGQRAAVVGPGQGPEGPADGARAVATKTDAAQNPPQLGIDLGAAKALLPVATPAQSAVARPQRAAKDPAGLKPLTPDALSDWVPRKISSTAQPQAAAGYGLPAEGPATYAQPAALALTDVVPHADLPTALGADKQLAQTISYWLGQGVQNAELKLDGFGAEPVAVRISVAHGEAHIGFRSDQAEVRQLIEGAVLQLRDLLGQEGLTLAGVSIGSSDQHPPGAQEQRPRFGSRKKDMLSKSAGLGNACFYPFVLALVLAKALNNSPGSMFRRYSSGKQIY